MCIRDRHASSGCGGHAAMKTCPSIRWTVSICGHSGTAQRPRKLTWATRPLLVAAPSHGGHGP
eukprot:4386963-Alexandrium_andersonii.AAC.1